MKIRPISKNQRECKEYPSCLPEEMSVLSGGYVITTCGEIIVVEDNQENKDVFSSYINDYLETKQSNVYEIYLATKLLCELGCIVYTGVRLEYIKNKLGGLDSSMGSLIFPIEIENITDIQKDICLHLLASNQSIFGKGEKIAIQYGGFPDTVYTKEEVMNFLSSKTYHK